MCQGLTKKGIQCKNPTQGYCYLHKGQAPAPEPKTHTEPTPVQPIKNPYKELYEDLVIKSLIDNEDHKHALDKLEKELHNYKKMQEHIFQEKLRFKNLYHSTQKSLKKTNKEYNLMLRDKKFLDEYSLIDHYINLKVSKYTNKRRDYNKSIKNNIWDFNKIPNIGKILLRDLGITYKQFNYRFACIKRERVKLAHPQINLEYGELLKNIRDII